MASEEDVFIFDKTIKSEFNTHRLTRAGIVSPEYVRQIIYNEPSIVANTFKISKVSKRRIKIFLEKGLSCGMCGRKGTYFALERHVVNCKSDAWILNLYASGFGFAPGDDHEILMTIDHIIPMSKGGHPKHPDNMQTMCRFCNEFKSSKAKFWRGIKFKIIKHKKRNFKVPLTSSTGVTQ